MACVTSDPRRRGNQRDKKPSGAGRGGSRSGGDQRGGSRSGDRRGGPGSNSRRDDGPRSVEKPEQTFGKNARGSKWGGVARRGAHNASVAKRGWGDDPDHGELPQRGSDEWEQTGHKSRQPRKRAARPRLELPEIDEVHLRGMPQEQRDRVRRRLRDAGEAYLGDRFGEAEKLLGPLSKRHPQIPEIQELYGLTQYRLGRWKPALAALEMFKDLTGDIEQIPVQADCQRALGNHGDVRRLWDELRESGPDAAIMVEGRIVMAGSLADQDDVMGAIRLLEQGPVRAKRARDHHLRLWYSLADLYERAGDHQRARRGFERIEQSEPGYVDVRERLDAMG